VAGCGAACRNGLSMHDFHHPDAAQPTPSTIATTAAPPIRHHRIITMP